VPPEALQSDAIWATANDAGYMDEAVFRDHFVLDFCEKTIRTENNLVGRYALLVLDGHNSRINVDAMLTLAGHRVMVLCLPSHTTHVLQPLDSGVNKLLKQSLSDRLFDTLNAAAGAGTTLSMGGRGTRHWELTSAAGWTRRMLST
jgi:hypothetical protein